MKHLLSLVVISLFFISCQDQKTPEQLFEERASGVVVVLNEYYYEIKLPNGNSVYFTGFDKDGDLENFTPSEEDIKKNCKIMTGTGFFIDKRGTLLTNRHVAEPQLDIIKAKDAYVKLIKSIKEFLEFGKSQLQEQYAELQRQKDDCYYFDLNTNSYYYDTDKIQEINSKMQEIEESYDEANNTLELFEGLTDPSALKVSSRCRVGIGYHDTFITSIDDFMGHNECVVTKLSEKEDVDLAQIQLKNKKTPDNAFIFNVEENQNAEISITDRIHQMLNSDKDDGKLKIDQQLYMIGYNAGLVLGTTKQGIKVQMTSGKLTQSPDGQRLLYSIPTMQGSSGSPVIDEKGRLVGVNFAKLTGTDNFNFGIPIESVRKFLNY